jgi:hypothetical protein
MVEELKDFGGAIVNYNYAVLGFKIFRLVHGYFTLVECNVPNSVPKNVNLFGLYLKDRGHE